MVAQDQRGASQNMEHCSLYMILYVLGKECSNPNELEMALQHSLHQHRVEKKRKDEVEKVLQENCRAAALHIRPIAGDGNCLFAALGDQLAIITGMPHNAKVLRKEVVGYLTKNPVLKVKYFKKHQW